eukprot:jgi/Botrbrau1/19939/Bobra.0059s0056.1
MLQYFGHLLLRGKRVPSKGWTRLTSKIGPIGYYKGKGVKSVGHHTSKGGYRILAHKRPFYVVPDLTGFELRPYVGFDLKGPPKSASS